MALFGNCQYSKPGQLPLLGRNNKNCPTQSFNSLHCNKNSYMQSTEQKRPPKKHDENSCSVFIVECVFQRRCIDVDETVPKFCSLQEQLSIYIKGMLYTQIISFQKLSQHLRFCVQMFQSQVLWLNPDLNTSRDLFLKFMGELFCSKRSRKVSAQCLSSCRNHVCLTSSINGKKKKA